MSWLKPGGGGKTPDQIQEEAENAVVQVTASSGDPLLPQVTEIYSQRLFDTGLADEWLSPAGRFSRLFHHEQIFLNEGVADLDFVRECVRRSFGIASIIPHGPEGQKRCYRTSEDIEKIAVDLVALGYVLAPKE